MDIVKTLLSEHGTSLVNELTSKAGFTADQAKKFMPAATQQAFDKMKGLDLKGLIGGGDVSSLIGKMDLAGLGKLAGIDATKATVGLKSLLPMVMGLVKAKGFDVAKLTQALGGAGIGDIAKGVGKMFGKN